MKVIEIIQFVEKDSIIGKPFKSILEEIETRVEHKPYARVREINIAQSPPSGYLWFMENIEGDTVLFKSNYDTSG